MTGWLFKLLVSLSVCYLAIIAILFVFQRKLQYFPSQDLAAPAYYGAHEFTAVTLATSDGLELIAWHAPAKDGFQTLVYFHGNGGHIAHRLGDVVPFQQAGYGVLLVEYRGYGGNRGSPTEEGLLNDAEAAIDYLKQRDVLPEEMVMVGESLGSGVASQIAARHRNFAGMILKAPFSSAVDVGQSVYPWVPVKWLMADRFESDRVIARINMPLLVLHGTADRVIPIHFGRKLFAAAKEPKRFHVLQGAGHADFHNHGGHRIELEFLRALRSPG